MVRWQRDTLKSAFWLPSCSSCDGGREGAWNWLWMHSISIFLGSTPSSRSPRAQCVFSARRAEALALGMLWLQVIGHPTNVPRRQEPPGALLLPRVSGHCPPFRCKGPCFLRPLEVAPKMGGSGSLRAGIPPESLQDTQDQPLPAFHSCRPCSVRPPAWGTPMSFGGDIESWLPYNRGRSPAL